MLGARRAEDAGWVEDLIVGPEILRLVFIDGMFRPEGVAGKSKLEGTAASLRRGFGAGGIGPQRCQRQYAECGIAEHVRMLKPIDEQHK